MSKITPGDDVAFALDAASSEFFRAGRCEHHGEGRSLEVEGMIQLYEELCRRYPIVSIEDGMAEQYYWAGWNALTDAIGHKVQLVGDDIFVTNESILQDGLAKDSNISTAQPLVYELGADPKPIGHAYLGDPAVIAAALQAVANQGKAKIA